MWRKRRSALFVDFENVATKVSPDPIAALLAWLEDGKFDEAGGKRKLLRKKIYWNSSAEKHRDIFERGGFEVILCEKFSSLKNGADIRMALDILDTCWTVPEVDEYILFTTDSDFVPVLQRLTEKSKTSAILVNESKMGSHTAFNIYADIIIPLRLLSDAFTYRRQEKSLLKTIRNRSRLNRRPGSPPAPSQKVAADSQTQARKSENHSEQSALGLAERAVLRVASRAPKKFVPRKHIENQLRQIKGFKKIGASAYFGRGNYQALMLEIAQKNQQIKVRPGKGQSASVMYAPRED